jgi:hypothetical protein
MGEMELRREGAVQRGHKDWRHGQELEGLLLA